MMTKCDVVSWVVSWNRKMISMENTANLNKVWALVNNNFIHISSLIVRMYITSAS